MRDDEFEWDDAKAASNFAKHRVTFEAARVAFDDPNALDESDEYDDELRYILIGSSHGRLLSVAYTERGHRRRIISARQATQTETRRYQHGT